MGRRITKMGRWREEGTAEKMLCCVQSKNEARRRGKNSVSLHMYRFVTVCHVCLIVSTDKCEHTHVLAKAWACICVHCHCGHASA